MQPALELKGIEVEFASESGRVQALKGIDLRVDAGELVVLIGPSGQGKSTLLNVMSGLLRPSAGTVASYGEPVEGPGRGIGVIFQEDTVLPWLRVEDNVAWSLKLRGVAAAEWRSVAHRYLAEVRLDHVARAWPKELSGGMRKRVSIATAFASDPRVLLMDEPFGSLDFVTRATLHEILLRLWQEHGKTVVFVTHDVDETLMLADRVVMIIDGRVAEDIPVRFSRPRSDALREDKEAVQLRRHLLTLLGVKPETVV
jgi:NitT/TauT family transport system ATP-binding protein